MSGAMLRPDEQLGTFLGPDNEALALVVSRTGRSVVVRDTQRSGIRRSVARISHPLSESPRVDIEDWWRVRSSEWRATLKSTALCMLQESLPEGVRQANQSRITMAPSSVLGMFAGPQGRNDIYMTVARTGRSVAARLGASSGQIIARAYRPTCADPGISFEGLYRDNPEEWKRDFVELFGAALKRAIEAVQTAQAGTVGVSA